MREVQSIRWLVLAGLWLPGLCGAFPLGGVITEGTGTVSGVTVFAGTNTVISDVSGAYLFTNLAGAFIVTPTQAANFFNPAHRTLLMQAGLTNVNFERGVSNVSTLVTTCDRSSLAAALPFGGKIQFDCDGTIVFTNYLTFSNHLSIDAVNRDVIFDGAGTTRFAFVRQGMTCKVANLTFQNGRAPLEGFLGFPPDYYFGGAFAMFASDLSVENCSFLSNVAGVSVSGSNGIGGAIYNAQGKIRLTNVSFVANRVVGSFAQGGAIFVFGGGLRAEAVVDRCYFGLNSAMCDSPLDVNNLAHGGAFHSEALTRTALVHIVNSTFYSNFARDVSGALHHNGNGISVAAGTRLDMTNCTLKGNYNGSNELQYALTSGATGFIRGCIFQDVTPGGEAREAFGTIQDQGFNLGAIILLRRCSPTPRAGEASPRPCTRRATTADRRRPARCSRGVSPLMRSRTARRRPSTSAARCVPTVRFPTPAQLNPIRPALSSPRSLRPAPAGAPRAPPSPSLPADSRPRRTLSTGSTSSPAPPAPTAPSTSTPPRTRSRTTPSTAPPGRDRSRTRINYE